MSYSRSQIEAATTPAELQAILLAAESQPRWAVATLTEVATFFKVATSTVKGWRAESPPMPGNDGAWPLDAIAGWRHQKNIGSDLATSQKQATLEATQLTNDSRRLDLDKQRGEVLDKAAVELWAATALIEARCMIMSLPERLSTSAPPEMRSFIREETDRHCRDVLTSLRRRLEMDEIDENERQPRVTSSPTRDPLDVRGMNAD
ncbi:MAG: hypothetical protein NTW75_00250 [Planctomycetales bacterium]|nr:hypothetical protein [Planctomycetales bacterium]